MAQVTWGLDNDTAWASFSQSAAAYSDGHQLPAGRAMANGDSGVLVTSVHAHVSGRGGSRTIALSFGSSGTDYFSVPAAGAAEFTGWQNLTTPFYAVGGTHRLQVLFTGSLYFGRDTSGGTTYAGQFPSPNTSSFPGRLSGGVIYSMAPTAPRSLTVSPSAQSDTFNFSWTAPSDDGGSAVLGYDLYRDGAFFKRLGTTPSTVITVETGSAHTWTVRARNRVTDARSTTSVASNSVSTTAQSPPSAPRNLAGTSHPSIIGATQFRWDAPSDPGGGIFRYLIYRDTELIHSGITPANIADPAFRFNDTGLIPGVTYKYDVRAQTESGVTTGVRSEKSNEIFLVAAQLPSAPRNLSVSLPDNQVGALRLSWTAPSVPGTGTITGYQIRTSPTGAVVATVGNVTTATITGLSPTTTYTYVVRALTSLSVASGSTTPYSSSVSGKPVGDPPAPTGVVVAAPASVIGRLVLSWNAVGGPTTGYKVYDRGVEVADLPASVTRYIFDNLTGTHTYTVRARNIVTDDAGTIGPASAAASGTPLTYSTQTLTTSRSATDETVAQFSGTRTITAATARSFSFPSPGTDLATAAIGAGFGATTNLTNQGLNGTYTAIVGGDMALERTLRYTKNVAAFEQTAVGAGTITNDTNAALSGTFLVNSADALNRKVTYGKFGISADIPPRPTMGTVMNRSNLAYNVIDATILTASNRTITYSKTNVNLPLTSASGTVVNSTIRDFYNGKHRVTSIPLHNVFTFKTGFETGSDETVVSNVARNQNLRVFGPLSDWAPDAETVFTASPLVNLATTPSFEGLGAAGGALVRTNMHVNAGASGSAGISGYGGGGTNAATYTTEDVSWSGSGKARRATWTAISSPGSGDLSPIIRPAMDALGAGATLTAVTKWRVSSARTVGAPQPYSASGGLTIVARSRTGSISAVPGTTYTDWSTITVGSNYDGNTRMVLQASPQVAGDWFEISEIDVYEGAYQPNRQWFWGGAPAAGDYTYNFTGAANTTTSEQRATAVAGISPTAFGGATGYRSSDWASHGSYSLRVTSTGQNTGIALTSMPVALQANRTYTITAKVRLTAPILNPHPNSRRMRLNAGGFTSTSPQAPNTAGVHTLSWTVTPTVDQTALQLWHGGTPDSPDIWWDEIRVHEGTVAGPYIDGNTLGARWTGAANASATLPASDVRATLTRTAPGTTRLVFPAYPDGSVFQTSNMNYTVGFSAALSATQADPEIPISVHVDYESETGEIISSLESKIITEEEKQFSWTVPGTQNAPRRVVIYVTGMVAGADTILFSKPFLVGTPISTLPFEGPYFDGNTPNRTYITYTWNTSPHQSTRTLLNTPAFPLGYVTPAFLGASSSDSTGEVRVKYRSGWIG